MVESLVGWKMDSCFTRCSRKSLVATNRRSVTAQNVGNPNSNRQGVAGVLTEQDMAETNASLISPEMFREYYISFLKERIAYMKQSVSIRYAQMAGSHGSE